MEEKDYLETEEINENEKDDNSLRKVMMLIGIVLAATMALVGVYTVLTIKKLNMLPMKYILFMYIVLVLGTLIVAIMNRWFIAGIFAKIISIAMIIIMIYGCRYINFTYNKMSDMMGVSTSFDDMNCYVMADDSAQNITDAKDYTFGIISEFDRDNTNKYVAEIVGKLGSDIVVEEYETVVELATALYDGSVNAIIMNGAYEGIVTGVEEYADFSTDTRIIDALAIEKNVSVRDVNENYLHNGDKVFTVYISGIDARGGTPKSNSNSDVNILLTVNMETNQIFLLSTPRDYYVPLSISGGVRDKLTHAGGYGIDVSVETMEMLYGVNIDNYMKINFTGFVRVIDALGGVEVNSDYDFSDGIYSYSQGTNYLSGEEALAFARCRYAFEDGDRQRGKHQMAVIDAVIKKMASREALSNYKQTLDSVSDCMITSMDYDDISNLVKYQLDNGKSWDVQKYSVNGFDSSNTTYSAGGQELYVMEPDQATVDQAKEYLKQIYSGQVIHVEE